MGNFGAMMGAAYSEGTFSSLKSETLEHLRRHPFLKDANQFELVELDLAIV